jgi:TolA-binding protein
MRIEDRTGSTPEPRLARLAELAHQRLGEMSDVQDARGAAEVVAKLGQISRRPSPRLPRPMALVGMAAVAAVILAALVLGPSLWRKRPLTYVMSDGEIQAGGYFRIDAHAHPTIRFSDGTKIAFQAGARGRVATVDAHGARVMLDEGEADVEVVPRGGSSWLFDAGPFLVHVRGTKFALAWKGDEGRLDLRLRTGAVSVTGPLSDQAISLHAGQWLTVRLATHEAFVRNLDSAASPLSPTGDALPPVASHAPAEVPPAVAPVPVVPDHRARARRPIRGTSRAPAEFDWASARAEGDWTRIVESASKRGVDRTLAERRSEDLALLADAAHYLHHDDLAERALLAQRQRFAGSTRAKDAAFLLGRIVESRPGGSAEALAWYDRHLDEAPSGVYASEALGRKMTVLARLRGAKAARPVAEEYLRRYPAGTYARTARAYVGKL